MDAFLRFPERAGEGAAADGEAAFARKLAAEKQTQEILSKGEESVGWYKWQGPGGPDPAADWQISTRTSWGHDNDFGKWLRDEGPEPGPESTMNCWEGVMYTAYRGGAVDKATLQGVHAEAAEAGRAAYAAATADGLQGANALNTGAAAYYRRLQEFLGPGEHTAYTVGPDGLGGPDIPAGHVIVVDDDHVMMSLGTRDAQGRMEVLSHWNFPNRAMYGFGPRESYGMMQRTSVEEVLGGFRGRDNVPVTSAAPTWAL